MAEGGDFEGGVPPPLNPSKYIIHQGVLKEPKKHTWILMFLRDVKLHDFFLGSGNW